MTKETGLQFMKMNTISCLCVRLGRVNINSLLECGEVMLVFCELGKLCTERGSLENLPTEHTT